MGFNLGVALGAGVQSGLSTYERLNEEQRKQAEFDYQQKQRQQEAALDAAYAETQGRVGQNNDYAQAIQTEGGAGSQQAKMLSDQAAGMGPENEAASAQSVVGALRQNAGQAPAAPSAISPQTYTQNQASKDYVQAASKISRKGAMEALQMKSATRASDLEDRFDTAQKQFQDHLTTIHSAGEAGGLKGLSEAANKEGLKTKFVEGKNGLGAVQVLGSKGDVLQSFTDVKSATDALVGAASKHFQDSLVTMFGSADKAAAYYETRRGNDIKQKEVDIKEPYYKAAANLHNAQAGALGKTAEITAAGKAYMEEYNKLSPQEKNGPKGKELLDQAEAAMAAKSGDVSRIRAATPEGRADAAYQQAVLTAQKNDLPIPNQAEFKAKMGFAPDAVKEGEQAKIDDMLKKGDLDGAIKRAKQFNSTFKHTPLPVPSGAVPVPR